MPNEQKNLTVRPSEPAGSPALIERIAYYQAAPQNEPESGDTAIPFAHYRWMINRHKWRLLLFVAIAVGATTMVSSRLTKYYESTVTIDVDRAAPQGVIGQDAAVGRTAAFNDSELFLQTQIQLIKSDSVIRPVVQKLKSRLPAAAGTPAQDEGPLSLDHFAVTRPPRTYLLLISYRNPDPEIAAQVANDVADSYIKHSYVIRGQDAERQSQFMERQLEDLKAKMETSAAALLQFEKELDVISPEEKTNILSARLLQLNTEWTNAREDLIKKAAADKSVRSGSVEALEASLQGEQLKKLEEQMADEAEKFATIKTQFGPRFPEYLKAATRQSELSARYEALKKSIVQRVDAELREAQDRESQLHQMADEDKNQFDRLNSKSLEYKNLKRDADADKAIFDDLSKKIKEAGINAGFQSNGIRIADPARPARRPIYPRITFNALVAFLVSLCLGIGVIFMSESLDHTLRDPDQIQRQLQTEVLGALPVVKAWRGHLPLVATDGSRRAFFGGGAGVANTYEEAVRTLRDSILLPNGDRRPKSLLITSATPREGKTTTAVHLAVVHSQQKRKTLLIDSDLRRPGVYQHAGISNDKGFSNVINGEASWRDLLQTPEGLPHLSVLAAGPPSRRAADGVGTMLKQVLAEAADEYDLVICDAPPLLGFAESLQIAALVDGVVVVALAGQTERAAVASVLSSLKRLKANVIGLALNEVRADMSERYYYYGYYGKYYSRYYKTLSN
jgi:capsular exopolysaccharide synthesis family protein